MIQRSVANILNYDTINNQLVVSLSQGHATRGPGAEVLWPAETRRSHCWQHHLSPRSGSGMSN